MVQEIRGKVLLDGRRGKPAADKEAVAEVIVALSRLAAANAQAIRSIEINPLLAMPQGEGALALDAAIESSRAGPLSSQL